MKKSNKKTILRGNSNLHTLHGEFKMDDEQKEFADITVLKDTVLRHEQPNGSFGEHHALKVDKGNWIMGKQVEYNPFKQTISQVWD
jgi:hypothetical protein